MDDAALARYSRQMILPDWGAQAQLALQEASVLIVGLGGLGSAASLYLTAAGIGRLMLVDDDRVELANLQRQILHGSADIDLLKTISAENTLRRLNPAVEIETHALRLQQSDATAFARDADLVLDGSDNFATRYCINTACVKMQTPLVTGSVIRWQGQITTLRNRKHSPCYACVFPDTGGDEETSCAEAGILAPLPGVIGAMQALEAMKLIGSTGEVLDGRLLTLDAKTMQWSQRQFEKDPRCAVCGV